MAANSPKILTALELCAGGGGQALGLELAGFHHAAAVEYEKQFCTTLRKNRPHWNVCETDIRNISGKDYKNVDVVAAGVPCPPFSIAGHQLGADDERDMFPAALKIVADAKPRAVWFENVPGLAAARFSDYRKDLTRQLNRLGYDVDWRILQAADFGVPQLRPRFILVAMKAADMEHFNWPILRVPRMTVGESLLDLMAENGWLGAEAWATQANGIGPTLVGGSKKHGGPDLGPTRAKQQWRTLGVDGLGIADQAPGQEAPIGLTPRLTVRMAARIQSFPDTWEFTGGKTAAYRQVGNAFPPAVARAVGTAIRAALTREKTGWLYSFEPDTQFRFAEDSPKYGKSSAKK